MRLTGALGALAAAVVVLAMPTSSQAQFPTSEEYATPPSWWYESLGAGGLTASPDNRPTPCVANQVIVHLPQEPYEPPADLYVLTWDREQPQPFFDQGNECSRYWGSKRHADTWTKCDAHAWQKVGDPANIRGEFRQYGTYQCQVSSQDTQPEGLCRREATFKNSPASFEGAPDNWYIDDTGWEPRDCRVELPGWPNEPNDVLVCASDKKKLKKAKKELRKADTRREVQKARKLVRAAKVRISNDCPA